MDKPHNEAGELRAALERGEWRKLLDPAAEQLLVLAVLDRPGAWATIAQPCATAIVVESLGRTGEPLRQVARAWFASCLPPEGLERAFPPHLSLDQVAVLLPVFFETMFTSSERPRQALALAQQVVANHQAVRGGGTDDLEAALAVLERWPV